MPFLPETWKAKVTERFWEWRLRVEQARPVAVYSTLSAAALWPLVQAAQSTGMLPVALALGNVVAGVGGNLIAEQIPRWHDQAHPPSEVNIATWITAHITTNADLRQALDTILEQLQVISQARECLQVRDQQGVLRHVLGSAGSPGPYSYTTRGVEPPWAAGFLCDRTHSTT